MFVGIRDVLAIDSHDIMDCELTFMLLNNKLFCLFVMSPLFCFVYSVVGVPPFENRSVRWAIVLVY